MQVRYKISVKKNQNRKNNVDTNQCLRNNPPPPNQDRANNKYFYKNLVHDLSNVNLHT